jgi:hypothetical protein
MLLALSTRNCLVYRLAEAAGRLFLVADAADAQRLMAEGIRRGEICDASEVRRVITLTDPETVAEVHWWKR